MMSEKPKPCICGAELKEDYCDQGVLYDHPQDGDHRNCLLAGIDLEIGDEGNLEKWNNRPIEDALQEQVNDLKIVLAEIKATHEYYLEHDNLIIDHINEVTGY